MPPARPRPEPTTRQILAAVHPKHLSHGAVYKGAREDGSRCYRCLCGETLVVTAQQVAGVR